MRILAVLLVLPLFLACSGETSAPGASAETEAAEPVMLGDVDLNQPLRAIGTEPFWAVEITPATLTYRGVDRPEQAFDSPDPDVQGTTAVYEVENEGGATMTITLMTTECSDGMSDRIYPLTAMVEIGDEALNGCAQSVAAMMAEPRP